jgi:hypothetical protein
MELEAANVRLPVTTPTRGQTVIPPCESTSEDLQSKSHTIRNICVSHRTNQMG